MNDDTFNEETQEESPSYTSIDDLLRPPDDVQEPEDVSFPPPTPEQPQPQAQQPTTDDPQAQLKQEFLKRLSSGDPAEAFIFAAQVGAQAATQQIMQQIAPIKTSLLTTVAEIFRREKQAEDPKLYSAASKYFEAYYQAGVQRLRSNPQLAASLNEQQVREALEQFWAQAKARVLDSLLANSRKVSTTRQPESTPQPHVEAPEYSPSSAPSTPKKTVTLQPKTETDALVIDLARQVGLSDEDIAEIIA